MLIAVIFDLDGTIADTERLHDESFRAVFKERGIEPIPNDQGMIHVSGLNALANFDLFQQQYNFSADSNQLVKEKTKVYNKLLEQGNIAAMPGIYELLNNLKSSGVKMAVASSSTLQQINIVAKALKILNYFDVFASGKEVQHGKPAPDVFLLAAKKLSLAPSECIVIEDANSGVVAAKAAGMKVVAAPNEFTLHEDFSAADLVVKTLGDLDSGKLRSLLK